MDLREFVDDTKMIKKIYDKVVYLRRKEKQNMVLSTNEPEPSSNRTEAWSNAIKETPASVSVSCSSPNAKAKWNQTDERKVEEFFAKYSVRPGKDYLRALFQS